MAIKLEYIDSYLTEEEITDINAHMGTPIERDLKQYKELVLVVYSDLDNAGHNANPTIKAYDYDLTATTNYLINDYEVAMTTYTNERTIITKYDWYVLDLSGAINLNIGITCANAPTSGSISVHLYGVRN